MAINKMYKEWVSRATDEQVKSQLEEMKVDLPRMEYAFHKSLSFGTAGIRGIMDAGVNCLNPYTIAAATEGLSTYLLENNGRSVVISYDSRINSRLFATITANILVSHGIKAYITTDIMPVAFVSFAVRHLACSAGIMITASHNSKEYNGYKVFNDKGIQIDVETADIIADKITQVDCFSISIKGDELSSGVEYIKQDTIDDYLTCVYSQSQMKIDKDLMVVYSALNGAGYKIVPQVLQERGLTKLENVASQCYPDGEFLTCPSPNPDKHETLRLGVEKMLGLSADILLATDPDCDRVGVVVNQVGQAVYLTGNETGILLCDYLLASRQSVGTLSKHPVVVNSIVSTRLVAKIVKEYAGSLVSVLTGFKYIGDYVTSLEEAGRLNDFVLGFEESCGYLVGTHARDKDAVVACMLIAEMASYYKAQGFTLVDRLNQLYDKYGRYQEKTMQLTFAGASGDQARKYAMMNLRASNVHSIDTARVVSKIDLSVPNDTGLPLADVIIYRLEGDHSVIVRPSGTEPLIKLYISCSYSASEAPKHFERIYHCFGKFFGNN